MPFGLSTVLDMGVHVGSLLGGAMEGMLVFDFIDENFNRLGIVKICSKSSIDIRLTPSSTGFTFGSKECDT